MFYELQPLRLQAGWKIELNNFSEYDIQEHGDADCTELCEDLLQLTNERGKDTVKKRNYSMHREVGML